MSAPGGLGARGPLRRLVRRQGFAQRPVQTVGVIGADANGGEGIAKGVAEGDGGADKVDPLLLGPTTASKYVQGLGEGVNVAGETGNVFVGGAKSTASAANLASRASKGAARVSRAA